MIKSRKIVNILLVCILFITYACSNTMLAKASNKMNLALNKPATVSYQDSEGHGADKVVDGDLGTRWGTDPKGTNQWFRVDLQHVFNYDEFYIASENSNSQKIRKYKIEGSNDDESYTMLYQSEDKPAGYDLEQTVVLEQSVSYRYVKITVESLIPGAYPSISLREFGVYGDGGIIGDVENALKALTIPTKLYRDYTLPIDNNDLGVQFAWSSDDDAIVIEDGIAKVQPVDEQKSVTLHAQATKENYTQSKSFEVQIMPNTMNDYKIYPIPHKMENGTGILDITSTVNVVIPQMTDENATEFLKSTLEAFQLNVQVSDEVDPNSVNIFMGIKGDKSLSDDYFKEIDYDKSIAENTEGYVLHTSASDKTIAILGKDKEGAFNGIFTLKQMLESSSQSLKDITISDAPDTKFRGVIEGFYGTYSHKERLDLLKYIGPLKMNTYVYGSKSDTYHYGQWRDLYPEAQIKELAELVECGKQNNVEVIWSAHVGGHINMSLESDYQALVRKFDQLYDIGVRQFGLFYDDAGTDNTYLSDFINRVNREYIAKKDGVKDLIMCPQQYNKKAASDAYLSKLAAFDKNVQVMWTGDDVISEINPAMMDYIEGKINRPAYVWWNYPVNDLGMGDQLLIGETVGLSTEMNKMNGVVSNPMLQWQASKFSVFSIADYTWNVKGFDRHESWKNGVSHIIPEKDYADAFRTFAANNNQTVNELRKESVESEYLIPTLDSFKQKYYLGDNIEAEAQGIKDEFQKIKDAYELLKTYSNNQDLVNQIMPWINSMEKVMKAGNSIMDNILYMNANDLTSPEVVQQAYQNYLACQSDLNTIGGKFSGRRVITPFLQEMQSSMKNILTQKLGMADHYATVTNYRDGAMKIPDMNKMVDGDSVSYVSMPENEADGNWFGLDLGKITNVHSVELLLGENDDDKNVSTSFKLQTSQDGVNWQDMKVDVDKNTIRSYDNVSAKFIRYYTVKGSNKQVKVREFSVNKTNKTIYTNVADYQNQNVTENGNELSLQPIQNLSLKTNEYIGIQFNKVKDLADMSTNIKDLTLEYSMDSKTWNTYQGENFQAKYVRLINLTDKAYKGELTSFGVRFPEKFTPKDMSITRSSDFTIWSGNEKDLIDGNRDTLCWTREQKIGQYYAIDLHEEMPIKDISVVMISGDVLGSGVVEISKDNTNWESVGTINGEPEKIIKVDGDKTARYVKVRVTGNSDNWLKINEIEINKEANKAEIPVLDNERANTIIDRDITTSYTSKNGTLNYFNFNTPFAQSINIFKNADSVITIEGLFNDEWKTIITDDKAYISANFKDFGYAAQFRISWSGDLTLYEFLPGDETVDEVEDTTLARMILNGAIIKANTAEATGQLDMLAPAVKQNIIMKRDAALAVYNDNSATNKALINAWLELADALHFLDFKADKTALKTLIDTYKDLPLDIYTEESANIFRAAYQNAQDVYADETALQQRINEAYTTLDNAVNGLVKKDEADKTVLKLMIDAITEKIGDGSKYKKDEYWNTFIQALNNANDILQNEQVTQKDVNDALNALTSAYEDIRLLPDESQLAQMQSFIAKVKQMNRSLYSEDQLIIIDQTYDDVQAMLNDFDSKRYSQVEKMMADVLNMAPENDEATVQEPTNPEDINKEETIRNVEINTKPATGDNTSLAGIMLMLAVSGCGVYLSRRKKNS